jgi:multiple sugar transport system permease protein
MATTFLNKRGLQIGLSLIRLVSWLCLVCLMLFPIYWALITSFKPPYELVTDPPIFWPRDFSAIENYRQVFKDIPMARYFFNSLHVAAISTVSVLLTSSLAGYVFEKFRFPGRELFFMGIIAVMMVPGPVRLIPLYLIFSNLHLLDTLPALYVGALMTPYGVFLMRQFMTSIPSELVDAARIDGSSELGIYVNIVLPLCKPALSALGIFRFMTAWNDYLWPLIVINTNTKRTLPLGIATYRNQFGMLEWNKIMASAMIAMIPVLVAFLIGQRNFIGGITLTGLKG